MATYYVRKSGNDGLAGTTPATAWLTIGHAAATVAAGDTVYVGAGTYREVTTFTTSGTLGNVISFIADLTGAFTGDAGDVIQTAWLTNDITAPSATSTWIVQSRAYLSFYGFQVFAAATGGAVGGASVGTVNNLTFTSCRFVNDNGVVSNMNLPADVNSGIVFDRCHFQCGLPAPLVQFNLTKSAVADYDAGFIIRNCALFGSGGSNVIFVQGIVSGNTLLGGGGIVSQCAVFGGNGGINDSSNLVSSKYPLRVEGCYLYGATTGMTGGIGSNFCIVEDWNIIEATTPRTNVASGPNSVGSHIYAPGFEAGSANMYPPGAKRLVRPWFMPMAGSPLLGWMPKSTQIAVGIPTAAADNAAVGTVAWTNPNNVLAADGVFATSVLLAGNTGHYLAVTGFGFAIPGTATITQLRVELSQKQAASNDSVANSIRLIDNTGTIVGNDNSANLATPTTGLAITSVINGAGDLWGVALTPAMVNSANFGVAVSYKDPSGAASTVSVDYLRIVINYTDTTIPNEQTIDLQGNPRPAGGSTNIAIGPYERGNTAVLDSSVFPVGFTSSFRIDGPGWYDFPVAVDPVLTSLAVQVQYNASYTGTLPQVLLLANGLIGVTSQTLTSVAAASAWSTLTFTPFTPTAKGVVFVRFLSNSTAAAGSAYFGAVQ